MRELWPSQATMNSMGRPHDVQSTSYYIYNIDSGSMLKVILALGIQNPDDHATAICPNQSNGLIDGDHQQAHEHA